MANRNGNLYATATVTSSAACNGNVYLELNGNRTYFHLHFVSTVAFNLNGYRSLHLPFIST